MIYKTTTDSLDWLLCDQWVKFDGDDVIEGCKIVNRVDSGVEQSGIRRVYVTDIFELWHKPGRKTWVDRGQGYMYEPAAFMAVWTTGETLNGYKCYSVTRVVRSGRKYAATKKDMIRYIEERYRGD